MNRRNLLILGLTLLVAFPRSSESAPGIPMIVKGVQEMLFSPFAETTVTKRGALFPSVCYDINKQIPTPNDHFTRFTGGKVREFDDSGAYLGSGPLQQYVDSGDLVVNGTYGFRSVRIKATNNRVYKVKFDKPTLAGPMTAKDFETTRTAFLAAEDDINRVYAQHAGIVSKVYDRDRMAARTYNRAWQDAIWEMTLNKFGIDNAYKTVSNEYLDALGLSDLR